MMNSSVLSDDQVRIAYRVVGSGPRDVILVHGWMVSGAVYDDLIAALDLSGVRLIIPDHRGTGQSDKPDAGYSIERFAKDVLAVADAVESRSFVVVGHSMGGQIAQYLAATAPERVSGVVLLCPVPAAGMPLPPEAYALFKSAAASRQSQQTILGIACKQLADDVREKLLDDAGRNSPACIEQALAAWTTGGFADKLSAIKAPTLVVGTDDPFLTPAILKAAVVSQIGGARFAYLPGPGHYVQAERPVETAALVQAFLSALRA